MRSSSVSRSSDDANPRINEIVASAALRSGLNDSCRIRVGKCKGNIARACNSPHIKCTAWHHFWQKGIQTTIVEPLNRSLRINNGSHGPMTSPQPQCLAPLKNSTLLPCIFASICFLALQNAAASGSSCASGQCCSGLGQGVIPNNDHRVDMIRS